MKNLPLAALCGAVLLLAGCGGGDDASVQTSKISFAVSDAPVDSASSVTIGFTQVQLVKADGTSIYLPVTPSNPSVDYRQIDLLDYQGTNSTLIISDQAVPVGTYKNLILHISTESNVNFVVDDLGTQPLKQPSNKLQLGSFTVGSESTQAFTIEFNLRYSLVMRGNIGNNNGYILKPHGVSILNNGSVASLSGTVDQTLFTAGSGCTVDTGNYVYLYEGNVSASTLGDLVDETDLDFNTVVPDGVVIPYASAKVADSGAYAFGYLPLGSYTVAFTCNGDGDDPVQYDGLTIPLPSGQVAEVTLSAGNNGTVDFSPAI